MRIIGLTGGISSGKSTVAGILESLGVRIIDADLLAREVVSPGEPAYQAIVEAFGTGILRSDGTIDRPSLGAIIFADSQERQRLEAITHPAIRQRMVTELAEAERSGVPVVAYVAPLLLESGAASLVNEIWVVSLDREEQIRRLMQRDGFGRKEALLRIDAQMPLEEKVLRADVVIDNSGSMQETERQVRQAWEDLRRRTPSAD